MKSSVLAVLPKQQRQGQAFRFRRFGCSTVRTANRSGFHHDYQQRLLGLTRSSQKKLWEPRWTGQHHVELYVANDCLFVLAMLRLPARR